MVISETGLDRVCMNVFECPEVSLWQRYDPTSVRTEIESSQNGARRKSAPDAAQI